MARYGLIGILAFAAEYSSFILILELFSTQNINIAQTISFCIGLLTSFAGSRFYTFSDETVLYRHGKKTQFTSYIMLAIINLILTNLFMYTLIQYLGVVFWIAKLVVMISVVAWNFTILNKVIFKAH